MMVVNAIGDDPHHFNMMAAADMSNAMVHGRMSCRDVRERLR